MSFTHKLQANIHNRICVTIEAHMSDVLFTERFIPINKKRRIEKVIAKKSVPVDPPPDDAEMSLGDQDDDAEMSQGDQGKQEEECAAEEDEGNIFF
jgi:hypothetical protein